MMFQGNRLSKPGFYQQIVSYNVNHLLSKPADGGSGFKSSDLNIKRTWDCHLIQFFQTLDKAVEILMVKNAVRRPTSDGLLADVKYIP